MRSPLLRNITLDVEVPPNDDVIPSTDLGALISKQHWPKLEFMSLHGIPLRLEDLALFAKRLLHEPSSHAPLIALNLDSVYLMSSTWMDALEVLRSNPRGWSPTSQVQRPRGAAPITEEEMETFRCPKHLGVWYTSPASLYIKGFLKRNPLLSPEDLENLLEEANIAPQDALSNVDFWLMHTVR
ncbi:Uu.00g129900.m01.CDS01 [Anthostomella pinea]|uniref:Uu.00g129900.m01.CDS01 n=1 Tax=Anthostomella pinea TaxID=933095 RepID=A0AAI8YI51_9PEZI|nr:Uu.00g129900.m01.CDS01 [Anthostomella pinea]